MAYLRAQRDALLDHDPGTRLGRDPEDLHDMRVAVRRLRAALAGRRRWLGDERVGPSATSCAGSGARSARSATSGEYIDPLDKPPPKPI